MSPRRRSESHNDSTPTSRTTSGSVSWLRVVRSSSTERAVRYLQASTSSSDLVGNQYWRLPIATPAFVAIARTLVPEYPFSRSESAAAWMIWSRVLSVAVAPVIRMYQCTDCWTPGGDARPGSEIIHCGCAEHRTGFPESHLWGPAHRKRR